MRFIKKKDAPGLVLRFISEQKRISHHPTYADFCSDMNGKTFKLLKKQLFLEQGGLCCYCNRFLEDYHLEHFLPQSQFKYDEVECSNLFLSCQSPFTCGKKKGNLLISKYITHPNCSSFFTYNTSGEILPRNTLNTVKKITDNWYKLTTEQKDLFLFIETLNLNHKSLVEQRKQIYREDYTNELTRLHNDKILVEERILELKNEDISLKNDILIFWLTEFLKK